MNAKVIVTTMVLAIAAAGCDHESDVTISHYSDDYGWYGLEDQFDATVDYTGAEQDVLGAVEIDYDELDLDELDEDLHWGSDPDLTEELADATETISRLRKENLELKALLSITEDRLESAIWALHRARVHAWSAGNYVTVLACIDAHDWIIHRVYYHLNRHHHRWFVDVRYRSHPRRPNRALLDRLQRYRRRVVELRRANRRLRRGKARTIAELRRRRPVIKSRPLRRARVTALNEPRRPVKANSAPNRPPAVRKDRKTDIRRITMASPSRQQASKSAVIARRNARKVEVKTKQDVRKQQAAARKVEVKARQDVSKQQAAARKVEVKTKQDVRKQQAAARKVEVKARQDVSKQQVAARKVEVKARQDAGRQVRIDRRGDRKQQRASRVAEKRQVAAEKRATRVTAREQRRATAKKAKGDS